LFNKVEFKSERILIRRRVKGKGMQNIFPVWGEKFRVIQQGITGTLHSSSIPVRGAEEYKSLSRQT